MKSFLFPALLCLAIPALAQAPAEQALPFKGANTITIHAPDSATVAYKKMAALLLEAGYSVAHATPALLSLNTEPQAAPRYNMMHQIRMAVAAGPGETLIRLSDAFTLPGAAAVSAAMAGTSTTEYRGGNASTFMICWKELQRVAQLYPNTTLSYSKR